MRGAVHLILSFEGDLVDVAPEPVLAGLIGLKYGMPAGMEMGRGMAIGGVVATAHVRTQRAAAQVHPFAPGLEAFDASRTAGALEDDRVEVRAGVGHRVSSRIAD